MSGSELDDTAMTSSSGLTSDVNRVLRLTGAKTNSRYFSFPWKQRNISEINSSRNLELKDAGPENLSNSKISNGFLKNIKKRLRLKNLSLCKANQKIITINSQCNGDNVDVPESQSEERSSSFVNERHPIEANERVKIADSDVSSCDKIDEITGNSEADACWESYSSLENQCENEHDALSKDEPTEVDLRLAITSTDDNENNSTNVHENAKTAVVHGGNVAEPQSARASQTIEANESIIEPQLSNNNSKAKVNLSEELLKLSKYGWYWGPISGDEADSKLVSEPDGAFLVRDSSDDRYLLTLSFKSSGRLLHARMEHSGGLFSLCNQGDNEGYTSVAALIDHSMNSSQSAVFCYSRPKYPGYPSFPVRLTKPVSRFTQVRSLQYLCRFVIRQNTRLDNIRKLPLPKTIRGYIEEAHY